MLTREDHKTYEQILREELTPAFGCTEPIALAYCAAKAREVLGQMPTEVIIEASGNIIKNVKSVIVPNTGGMKGIPAAAAAGIVAGDSKACLEVIAKVTPEEQKEIAEYLKNVPFSVKAMEDGDKLDIRVTVKAEENSAVVRVSKHHTDIVYIAHNGEVMLNEQDDCECAQKLAANQAAAAEQRADRSRLSIEGIVEYAKTADLSTVSDLLNRQIEYNYNIAQAGVKENWGANVGSVLLDTYGEDVRTKARAYAEKYKDDPYQIWIGSGNLWGPTYSFAMCVLEESQWLRTKSVTSPEFFHGTIELVEKGVCVALNMTEGQTRKLDQRVKDFVGQYTDDFTVFDTADYELPGISDKFRWMLSPVVINAVLSRVSKNFEQIRDHSLDIRRYYRKVE